MKKQEFRQYKTRSSRTALQEYEELKTRTIAALGKLGHQKFSAESGGYSLENWMKGVNLLLDEFEEKVGAVKLPPEYAEKRREMKDLLSKPVDVSSINEKILELGQAESEVSRRIDEAREQTSSKIEGLQSELAKCSADLEEEKRRLSDAAAGRRSEPFFGRLFGRNSKSVANASEDKVRELESKLSTLTSEILVQQKSVRSIDQRSSESPWAEEWKKLESLQVRLEQLEDEKLEREQLIREREEITASIASTISRISPGEGQAHGETAPSS
jgi:SMC interacting uncharacterized protein involved in chromosome segregation